MQSIFSLFEKGVKNPHEILPFLKWKTGVEPWGRRGPRIRAAELKYMLSSYAHQTTSIWDEDWDLLVVLDACRPEWLRKVQSEYNFISEVDTIHSVGSHSDEWISNTFNHEYADQMEDTIYITGNHYADGLENSNLATFETAHDYGGWAYDSASPPAHIITDLAVTTARETNWERCIVHYMQPHKPFLSREGERHEFSVKDWSLGYEPYRRYLDGKISMEDLHAGFISNLKYVLEEVELLLANVDASSTVLTSDHGQSLGEDGLWDHTAGVKHPSVRRVPWVETIATDKKTLDPDIYESAQYDEEVLKQNLQDLGYR